MAEAVDEQAVTMALVVQRLDQQDNALKDIKYLVNEINHYLRESVVQRLVELEKGQAMAKRTAEDTSRRIDELKTIVDANETRIDQLEELMVKLVEMMNLMKWVGGIIGSAVVVWVVSQLLALIH